MPKLYEARVRSANRQLPATIQLVLAIRPHGLTAYLRKKTNNHLFSSSSIMLALHDFVRFSHLKRLNKTGLKIAHHHENGDEFHNNVGVQVQDGLR